MARVDKIHTGLKDLEKKEAMLDQRISSARGDKNQSLSNSVKYFVCRALFCSQVDFDQQSS